MSRRSIPGIRAVVTGASSGIGCQLALELARQGARLVLTARREDRLVQLVEEIQQLGQEAHAVAGDITDAQLRSDLLDAAQTHLGGLDLLATDTATPLANAALLMVRNHLFFRSLPDVASRFVSHWQDEIYNRAGSDIRNELDRLADTIFEQAEFARWSLRFIESLEMVDRPEKGSQAEAVEDTSEIDEGEAGFDQAGGESRQDDSAGQESLQTNLSRPGDDDQDET